MKKENKLVVYKDGEIELDLLIDGETVWYTQEQLAELYDLDLSRISRHLAHGFEAGVLEPSNTCGKRKRSKDGKLRLVKHYNLEAALYVGMRADQSPRAIKVQRWGIKVLRAHLVDGFTLNQALLEKDITRRQALSDAVRAIRLTEQDYVFEVEAILGRLGLLTHKYVMADLQNLVHRAAAGGTAAEIVAARYDPDALDRGQTSYGSLTTAKTYMTKQELQWEQDIWEMFRTSLAHRISRGLRTNPYEIMQGVLVAAIGTKSPKQLLPHSGWSRTKELLPKWSGGY